MRGQDKRDSKYDNAVDRHRGCSRPERRRSHQPPGTTQGGQTSRRVRSDTSPTRTRAPHIRQGTAAPAPQLNPAGGSQAPAAPPNPPQHRDDRVPPVAPRKNRGPTTTLTDTHSARNDNPWGPGPGDRSACAGRADTYPKARGTHWLVPRAWRGWVAPPTTGPKPRSRGAFRSERSWHASWKSAGLPCRVRRTDFAASFSNGTNRVRQGPGGSA